MQDARLRKLEEDLGRVPGIVSARVIGEHVPSEIHVVATKERPAKQLVRDVQSLAAAGVGMTIDHRIVSVVQLEEDAGETLGVPEQRPRLERVVLGSQGQSSWITVTLAWPDGALSEGGAQSGTSRDARARGATEAVVQAIAPALSRLGARVEVNHALIHSTGDTTAVVVHALYCEGDVMTPLVGAALIQDDVASAAVRALLQAVNRKLRWL